MAKLFEIHPQNPQQRLVKQVVDELHKGSVIVYPTDSGYALGTALGNKNGLERIRQIRHLSKRHDFTLMMKEKVDISPTIGSVVVSQDIIKQMRTVFDHDTIVSVARYAADSLAEYSKILSLVAYYDDNQDSDLIQFRVRRSHSYNLLDLRIILEAYDISNGGGHPGAIGFRIPSAKIPDLYKYVEYLVKGIEQMILEKGFSK